MLKDATSTSLLSRFACPGAIAQSSYVVSRHSLYGNKCCHWRHIYGANDTPYPHRAFTKATVSADPPGRSPRARAPWTL